MTQKEVMVMKTNQKIVISTIAFSSLALGLMITQPYNVAAKTVANVTWVANQPSAIASLNSDGTYTVRSGDTIWAIGMHYNIKPSVIEDVNQINNPYDLQIGTILQLQISKKNDKAVLFVRNADGKVIGKKTLTKKDKIVKKQAFGKPVTPQAAQKANVMPTAPTQKVAQQAQKHGTAQATTTVKTPSSLPSDQVLYMLAYVKAYNGFKNVGLPLLEVGSNSIGQGTADSTATAKIVGNDVVLTFVQMPGWKPYEVKYPIASLIKEYYHSASDKAKINKMIKTGEANLNSLSQGNKAPKQAVDNNNNHGSNGKTDANSNSNATTALPSGNVLAMLAYVKAYNLEGVAAQLLYTNTDGNAYVVGQGVSDSTAVITINGNNVTIKIDGTTTTYSASALVNEYYSTATEKAYINKLISTAAQNDAAYDTPTTSSLSSTTTQASSVTSNTSSLSSNSSTTVNN